MDKEKLKGSISQEQVSKREKNGIELSYIESHLAIRNANECFGFDGWSYEITELKEICRYDYKLKSGDGYKVGYEARVKVTVNGISREDVGAGSGIAKDLFDAIEGANKEAVSDAMKRALRTFGDMFGLSLYDKKSELHDKKKSNSYQKPQANTQQNEEIESDLEMLLNECKTEQECKDWFKIASKDPASMARLGLGAKYQKKLKSLKK